MASSSSNQYVTVEVREEDPCPYPSNLSATSFISVKLSGRDDYYMWKSQMLCLCESHDMLGFVNGTLVSPQTTISTKEKVGDNQTHHRLWRRSDALVKGWILGSLSKETLRYVLDSLINQQKDADWSAKDVWDELETIYAPALLSKLPIVEDEQKEDEERAQGHRKLYSAIQSGSWDCVHEILEENSVTIIDEISNNGNTALHVAVGSTQKPDFLQKLLEMTPEDTQLSDVRNSDGSTPLHVAAIVGNTEAAKILVARNRDLLLAKDNKGQTSLAIALSNMHTKTSEFLLNQIDTDIEKDTLFSGTSGDKLLVTVISSKKFRLAKDLMRHYERRKLDTEAVLMAIAQNFPRELNIVEAYMGTEIMLYRAQEVIRSYDACYNARLVSLGGCCVLIISIFRAFISVRPFDIKRAQVHHDAMELLDSVCRSIKYMNDNNSFHHYYTNPMLEATRQNAYEVVHCIVSFFKNAIWCTNKDGHNVIQYAVINRSENVYNLLYQMDDHKNIYRTIIDSAGNNLLHLAAKLAPAQKLNLISGAALKLQRELQWFKEVEEFVCPLNIIQKNSFGETPQMIFTREHKELVIEGENWMKSTAGSYTITAALITTIVFAAAITVPGGSNQETGLPLFANKTAFKIFAISNAVSLFTAVTSLLMFLSILTARFAEEDFLFKLPTKLIFGLTALFISTTAMILAFGATLQLVFGQSNSRILIPIAVLTCLPITSFVTLQFPLIIDMISATYGRSIFGRKYVTYSNISAKVMKRRFY